MIRRRVLYLLLAALLVFSFNVRVLAQEGDSETFSNGLTVSGDFLKFYHSVDDPDRLFGQPYTVVFPDPFSPGKQIQYFDRVAMEDDPTRPEGQRITLADLGNIELTDDTLGQPVPVATNLCRTISGKQVCYAFLQLYDKYGEQLFGQPITDAGYDENGRQVQYFTRARMEWRAEMPYGQRAVLSELGRWDFEKRIKNPQLKNPIEVQIPVAQEIQPKLFAFVARPLVAKGDTQVVYALLYNQYNKAIPDVTVSVVATTKDGAQVASNLTAKTNNFGFARIEFPVGDLAPNQEIQVTVDSQIANGPSSSTSTWFRVWW